MTHTLACALYCSSDGSLNALGTALAWVLGVPVGLALAVGAVRLFLGMPGDRKR